MHELHDGDMNGTGSLCSRGWETRIGSRGWGLAFPDSCLLTPSPRNTPVHLAASPVPFVAGGLLKGVPGRYL